MYNFCLYKLSETTEITFYWDWNAGDFHITHFSVVTALRGAPQWKIFDIETKKLLIGRNSRLALKCFDFIKVRINVGNTWQKYNFPGHCGSVGLL